MAARSLVALIRLLDRQLGGNWVTISACNVYCLCNTRTGTPTEVNDSLPETHTWTDTEIALYRLYTECSRLQHASVHMFIGLTFMLNTSSSSVNSSSSVTCVPPRVSLSQATFVGSQVVSEYAGGTVLH